jgi:hypothetical protein
MTPGIRVPNETVIIIVNVTDGATGKNPGPAAGAAGMTPAGIADPAGIAGIAGMAGIVR